MKNETYRQTEKEKNYTIGVDIGGTKMLMILIDRDEQVLKKKKVPTVKTIEGIVATVQHFMKESKINEEEVMSMGVGIPGILNSHEGIVIDSPQLGWSNVPFLLQIRLHFTFPIFINNDVNMGLLGEKWLGAAKHSESVVFVGIGTGIGSAIYFNGRLIEGSTYSAGELGYFLDREDVKEIQEQRVGFFGAFENRTSGTYLSNHGVSGEELFQAYERKEERAIQIIDAFITDLSIGLANITSFLNPEIIVIGGGVSDSLKPFLPIIQKKVASFTPISVTISLAVLQNEASAFGAVFYAKNELEKIK